MTAISAGDLSLLRAKGHKTIERLYAFGFPTMWTGRVNEAPDRGDRTITYDGGVMASNFAFADITAGVEVWFGSSAGAKDQGVRRLRSISGTAASGTIEIDWHDDVDLADNDHITIVHSWGPWPKYSWFTASGPTFKKDGPDGTTYTDQNEEPPPLVIMSRNYAAESAATVTIDASDSVAVANGATISSYAWSFTPSSLAGVSIASASSASTTITLPANSKIWVHCTVTDSNGNQSTGHRAMITGGGITEFSRQALSHRFGSTSVSLQVSSTSTTLDWTDFDDRSLVILTAEDYYGSTQKTISFRGDARYTDRQHVMFSGYLQGEAWQFGQNGTGNISMQLVTALPMFLYSVSLTGADTPANWLEMDTTLMTVAGNLFHLFYYHSTLMDIMDVHLPWSDTTKRSANDEFGEGDLIQKAATFAQKRLMVMTGNPQGELFCELDLNLETSANRTATTTIMTLTDEDVQPIKNANIARRSRSIVVTVSGGSSTGKPGTFSPLFATSGNVALAQAAPSKRNFDRLMLVDQTDANTKAARLAAVENRRSLNVPGIALRGHYREVFSPAKQEWVNLGLIFDDALTANLRSITDLENLKAIVRGVSVSPTVNGVQTITIDLDTEAPDDRDGITVTPPAVPDTTDSTTGDFDDIWSLPDNTSTPNGGELLIVNFEDDVYVSEDGGDTYTTRSVP